MASMQTNAGTYLHFNFTRFPPLPAADHAT